MFFVLSARPPDVPCGRHRQHQVVLVMVVLPGANLSAGLVYLQVVIQEARRVTSNCTET